MYLEQYPFHLCIIMGLNILSAISYFVDILIIWIGQGRKFYPVRLFLYSSISQLFCLIPQIIIPFITQSQGNPQKDDSNQLYNFIPETYCKIQGYFINSSWLSAMVISCTIGHSIYRALIGRQGIITREKTCMAIIGLICLAINVPLAAVSEYQNYGYTFEGNTYLYFCNVSQKELFINENLGRTIVFVVLMVINLLILAYVIIITALILFNKWKLEGKGLKFDNPLVQLWIFPVINVIFWNFNLIVKMLDAFGIIQPQQQFASWIWFVAQCVICCEGLVVSSLFYYTFSGLFMKRLPKRLRGILKFCACISCFNLCLERAKVQTNQETCLYEETEKSCDSSLINSSAVY